MSAAPFPEHQLPAPSAPRYFAFSAIWLGAVVLLADAAPGLALHGLLAAVVVASIPLTVTCLYLVTTKKIRRLTLFSGGGWLAWFCARRMLGFTTAMVWSLGATFFLLVATSSFLPVDWIALAIGVPVFHLTYIIMHRLYRREARPYLVGRLSVWSSCLIAPVFMVLGYFIVRSVLGDDRSWASFQDALASFRARQSVEPATAVFGEASLWGSYYAALKSYIGSLAMDALKAETLARTAILALIHFFFFLHVSVILAGFALPPAELRRIVAEFRDSATPPPMTPGPARALAVATFLACLLAATGLHLAEKDPERLAKVGETRDGIESHTIVFAERIDGRHYQVGTLAAVDQLHQDYLAALDEARVILLADLDAAFAQVEANVDPFLDWYYSLGAEYARLGKMLVGDVGDYLGARLQEHLAIEEAFATLEGSFENVIRLEQLARQRHEEDLEALLVRSRLDVEDGGDAGARVEVVESAPLAALELPQATWITSFEQRLGISLVTGGLAGGAAGLVAARVTQRLLASAGLKTAAANIAKVVAARFGGRLAGGLAGGAAGAAVGSAAPGAGTAVGAAVGFVVGVATAAGVDKAMLMLEENLHREQFKADILESLRGARDEIRDVLTMPAAPSAPRLASR